MAGEPAHTHCTAEWCLTCILSRHASQKQSALFIPLNSLASYKQYRQFSCKLFMITLAEIELEETIFTNQYLTPK